MPALSSGTPGRALQQALTMPQIITSTETLEAACRVNSISDLLLTEAKEGVVCVLAASVVGQFEELRYSVNISRDVVDQMTLQIAIEPWEGDVAMCAPARPLLPSCHACLLPLSPVTLPPAIPPCTAHCTASVPDEGARVRCRAFLRSTTDGEQREKMQEYSSGSSFIYIPRLTAGLHSVALASETAFATFNLRVEIFKKGTKPSPKSIAVRAGARARARWLRRQIGGGAKWWIVRHLRCRCAGACCLHSSVAWPDTCTALILHATRVAALVRAHRQTQARSLTVRACS